MFLGFILIVNRSKKMAAS
ncbi:hypothetical protein [uncultured Succinatimonas sp.]